MFLFTLKKIVSFWLMPLPLVMVAVALGAALVACGRRRRLGIGLVWAGLLALAAISNKQLSTMLIRPFESAYPPIPEVGRGQPAPGGLRDCSYIVVLGGGHTDREGAAAVDKLSSSSSGRILEAVRISRILPSARVIFSGPGEPGRPTHASVLRQSAVSLGLDPARTLLITTAHDTEDEAREVRQIAGDSRVALVTSAWHMPRAAALFRNAGVAFTACPADFCGQAGERFRLGELGWDAESVDRSTRAVHEAIGRLWISLRGRD